MQCSVVTGMAEDCSHVKFVGHNLKALYFRYGFNYQYKTIYSNGF
jgi:hypothetical protein